MISPAVGSYALRITRPTDHQPPSPSPFSPLPSKFYTFTRPNTPADYLLSVDFGDLIRLHGYTLHFNRQEEVQVSIDLEARQPLPADLQPVLYLLDSADQAKGATTDLPPVLVWYPPDQWPVGEIVRVQFNTLPWYTRNTPTYRLALGLVQGDQAWDISHRLRPTLSQPTDFAVRLPADGTLVELARIEQGWGMPQGGPVRRQFASPAFTRALPVNFDNQVKLLGYDPPQINTGGLTVSLYWQAVNTPTNLTRFVQLVGPDGRVYGQNDSAPDNGNYPTFLWQPGEVVAETVTFPVQADRPSGEYTLHIGFYQPDTGQRLLLASGGDHIEIRGTKIID